MCFDVTMRLPFQWLILPIGICLAASLEGADEQWPALYDPFRVRTLYLQMESSGWSSVVNDSDFDSPQNARLWTDGEPSIPVTVKRKSDPAIGQKVSVKIDVNARTPGTEWHGVEKLSLENGAEGGLVKEGFAWNMHRLASDAGIYNYPAAYASWVRLVVDGQLIGVYTSVEERDDQMLKNRGMWKEGVTWLYKYDPTPALEEGAGDSLTLDHLCYSPFARRNTCSPPANLEADLQEWIDMQSMLTLGAVEAFTGNGDGLFSHDGKNNFAADFIPPTELKRVYFPWDLDTGISDVSSPILGSAGAYQTVILGHPWFRQWFLHIMSDLLDGPLSVQSLTEFLDRLEPVLTPALLEDPHSSVEGDAAGHFDSLRQWVTNRVANVRSQIGARIGLPQLAPTPGEIVAGAQLTLSHTNSSGTIYYTLDGQDPRGLGGVVVGTAYSGPIILNNSTHVMARVRVGTNWSALRQGTYNIAGHAAGLKVTELMYQPLSAAVDSGEYEFLELQNRSATPINLSGCFFEGIGFRFAPGTIVEPGNFLVLVRSAAAFADRYPDVPWHGIYRGGLEKNGEKIRLKNSDGNNILSVEYDDDPPWALGANGFGWSLVNIRAEEDPDNPQNWRASANIHGSPGSADPSPANTPGVVINEVLTHTDPPQEDAIELHNPTTGPINIAGWYLSDQSDIDNPSLLKKFRIPAGTVLPPGAFKVFYQTEFSSPALGANAFALSSLGDDVYLSSADAGGNLTGYIVGADFGACDNGVAIGRFPTSRGIDFTALASVTLGTNNTGPRSSPVVINEIMYHPAPGAHEFIEFYNQGSSNVTLSGWRVEGAAYVFPPGIVIGPNRFLVLVGTTNISATQFRSSNNVPAEAQILLHAFDLENAGEVLALQKPDTVSTNPPVDMDRIRYNDKAPWPTEADGSGPSLERIAPNVYANEPLNWRTTQSGGSPGKSNAVSAISAIARGSKWKFNFLGRNLGSPWREFDYSDSGWPADRGPLGFGYGSVQTVLTNPPHRPVTTYLRKEFVVSDPGASVSSLTLSVDYDDGFVAWLNGVELVRRSMPAGAVNFSTLANTHSGGMYETIELTASAGDLRLGRNILAVEVHQASTNDSDLIWDAELRYVAGAVVEPRPTILSITFSNGHGATLRWQSTPGQRYRVQHSADLIAWFNLSPILTATNSETEYVDSTAPSTRRFYRVQREN